MEYRVLARKYRPATFKDLVGQEVLVRTLANAFATGRIAHGFLLTGIRGIGKTTTARIIARALNCIGEDGKGGPTTEPCGVCSHCKMIAEDRHPDVLEMDAASHTGVEAMRDLIEGVRYLPSSARTKVYIIDEVHMLSNNAFNALLKTLEEPPPHVKFIFATTEARKIPVTILSRCQRFDLKRLDTEALAAHLGNIATKEQVSLSQEALTLLAIAAEGSVRDGLSLLDQAIAHRSGEETIDATAVRTMLGLGDRSRIFSLLTELFKGEIENALSVNAMLYQQGADPVLVLQDALEMVHYVTRIKVTPAMGNDPAYSDAERTEAKKLAELLSMPVLTRAWQMLLKGLQEAKIAAQPIAALEMILVRIAYASELPTPQEIIQGAPRQQAPIPPAQPRSQATTTPLYQASRGHDNGTKAQTALREAAVSYQHPAVTAAVPDTFAALVKLFEDQREALIASQLKQFASVLEYQPGLVKMHMDIAVSREFFAKMAGLLQQWTGREWKVLQSNDKGEPTLVAQEKLQEQRRLDAAREHELVRNVMNTFPGAELVEVEDA